MEFEVYEIQEADWAVGNFIQALADAASVPGISEDKFGALLEASEVSPEAVCKVAGVIATPQRVAAIQAVIEGE